LVSIGSSRKLVNLLAFKGGNALRFVHGNLRSTLDLDFTADKSFPDDEKKIRGLLDASLKGAVRRFGVKARCQRVKRNPKRVEATTPTYDISVCFQLPGDRYYQNFDERKTIVDIIELEISINELVCDAIDAKLHPETSPIRICTIEDIISEKLRALLQQRFATEIAPRTSTILPQD